MLKKLGNFRAAGAANLVAADTLSVATDTLSSGTASVANMESSASLTEIYISAKVERRQSEHSFKSMSSC